MRGLRHVPYEDGLRQINLFSLDRRRLPADHVLAFKIFKGVIDLSPSDFFPELGWEGKPTEYCKDQAISSMKKQYALGVCR